MLRTLPPFVHNPVQGVRGWIQIKAGDTPWVGSRLAGKCDNGGEVKDLTYSGRRAKKVRGTLVLAPLLRCPAV